MAGFMFMQSPIVPALDISKSWSTGVVLSNKTRHLERAEVREI